MLSAFHTLHTEWYVLHRFGIPLLCTRFAIQKQNVAGQDTPKHQPRKSASNSLRVPTATCLFECLEWRVINHSYLHKHTFTIFYSMLLECRLDFASWELKPQWGHTRIHVCFHFVGWLKKRSYTRQVTYECLCRTDIRLTSIWYLIYFDIVDTFAVCPKSSIVSYWGRDKHKAILSLRGLFRKHTAICSGQKYREMKNRWTGEIQRNPRQSRGPVLLLHAKSKAGQITWRLERFFVGLWLQNSKTLAVASGLAHRLAHMWLQRRRPATRRWARPLDDNSMPDCGESIFNWQQGIVPRN